MGRIGTAKRTPIRHQSLFHNALWLYLAAAQPVVAATMDPISGDLLVVGSRYARIPDVSPPVDSTFLFNGTTWTSTPLPKPLIGKVGMEVVAYNAQRTVALWGGSQGYGNAGPPHPDPFQAGIWYWSGQQWTSIAHASAS
jgi:hypothetical protein